IQDESCEYMEITPRTLASYLYSWMTKNADKVKERIPVKHLAMMESLDHKIDPLEAAQMLFAIQFDRIMFDYNREKKRKATMADNTQNMKLANEMVKTLSHLMLDKMKHKSFIARGSKKEDRGVKGVQETFEQIDRVKKIYSEKYGDIPAAVALNPESRRKVYNAIAKVRKGDTAPMLRLLERNEEKLQSLRDGSIAMEDDEDEESEEQ
ncbi:MAG TPA: hypothetical protein VMW10_11360, partial [Alphaproteobacteria bacterium]|nr:hypothetical protein [Alphaproteobacteria bacterium]